MNDTQCRSCKYLPIFPYKSKIQWWKKFYKTTIDPKRCFFYLSMMISSSPVCFHYNDVEKETEQ